MKTCVHDLRRGFIPYWEHYKDKPCGKRAHWKFKGLSKDWIPLCTKHAKQRGLQHCRPIDAAKGAKP